MLPGWAFYTLKTNLNGSQKKEYWVGQEKENMTGRRFFSFYYALGENQEKVKMSTRDLNSVTGISDVIRK